MFNGLIKDFGKIISNDGKTLSIASELEVSMGASVAVNGACLSVVKYDSKGFCVELSSESASHLALENLCSGASVHLEPALRYGASIDGHLIQGHIDALGKLISTQVRPSGSDFFVRLPEHILPFVAHKGSIAIEGVSLTISEIKGDIIRLSIIPITLKDTLFGEFKQGRRLHIETDLLARYVARVLEFETRIRKKELSWDECELYSRLF